MTVSETSRPNRLPWPPMLLTLAALASIGLGVVAPLTVPRAQAVVLIGYAIAGLGLAVDLWAILTMRRARTNILPHRAADRLVTWGPFRFSRNPIYLANAWLLIGIGTAFGNGWFIVFALLSAVAVDRLAIRREERHLAIKFGNDWIEYSSKTPRWLIR
ncbi:Isoprenylcysteine carboxyl methyltransferase [Rhodopseudomonas palustris HaA2]|uniref:Isoprenylcysteine carboxyl methyltransferase n=1 Tax=Rhodopseudomonas palustris (strain HaA2) TaxID=316058 RepID=Q2IS31_RHOP2|nr:isoprenylcysteine carboxylmethyltransferase family protein [Rhodopseudomonas palustris]ABD08979.1 Isoprenylcysteine carboxyl methyltransferase [Rhodopseudomonas palustris HaA2]